jgi:hypothetical protein
MSDKTVPVGCVRSAAAGTRCIGEELANYGRLCREDDLTLDAAIKVLEGISAQRTAEAGQ